MAQRAAPRRAPPSGRALLVLVLGCLCCQADAWRAGRIGAGGGSRAAAAAPHVVDLTDLAAKDLSPLADRFRRSGLACPMRGHGGRLELRLRRMPSGDYDIVASRCPAVGDGPCAEEPEASRWLQDAAAGRGPLNRTLSLDVAGRIRDALAVPPAPGASLLSVGGGGAGDVESEAGTLAKPFGPEPRVLGRLAPLHIAAGDDACAICLGLPRDAVPLRCGHEFCSGCIEGWLARSNECPVCRHSARPAADAVAAARAAISRRRVAALAGVGGVAFLSAFGLVVVNGAEDAHEGPLIFCLLSGVSLAAMAMSLACE